MNNQSQQSWGNFFFKDGGEMKVGNHSFKKNKTLLPQPTAQNVTWYEQAEGK